MKKYFQYISLFVPEIIFFVVISFVFILFGYLINKREFRSFDENNVRLLMNLSENIDDNIEQHADIFKLSCKAGLDDSYSHLGKFNDVFVCDESGMITEVVKKSILSGYSEGQLLDNTVLSSLFLSTENGESQISPFYSSEWGEYPVFSVLYKENGRFYVGNIDSRIIDNFTENKFHYQFADVAISDLNGNNFYPGDFQNQDSNIFIRKFYYSSYTNQEARYLLHIQTTMADFKNQIRKYRFLLFLLYIIILVFVLIKCFSNYFNIIKPITELRAKLENWVFNENNLSIECIPGYLIPLTDKIQSVLYETPKITDEINNQDVDCVNLFINQYPYIIYVVKPDGEIKIENNEAADVFGESTGVSIIDRLEWSGGENKRIQRLLSGEIDFIRIYKKRIVINHRLKIFDVTGYTMLQKSGKETIFIIRDETERFIEEKNLLTSVKMETMSIMAGGFSHDFNNLLTIIFGNLDIFRFAKDKEKQAQVIENIRQSAFKASQLVKEIQIFSQKNQDVIQKIEVEDTLNRIIKMSRKVLPGNIKIKQLIDTENSIITANSNLFFQIFLNIIINARDAIIQKNETIKQPDFTGEIMIRSSFVNVKHDEMKTLGLKTEGKYILIEVKDNGIGIDEEILTMVFDPFFTTKERGAVKGRGLGLSTVYGAIKNIKGTIMVESEIGKYTLFSLYFPLMSENSLYSQEERRFVNNDKKVILLVDDDPEVLSLGGEFLKTLNFDYQVASDANEAVGLLNNNHFDLILLDLIMPKYDGRYLLEHLKLRNIHIPVVLITGYFEKQIVSEFETSGLVKGIVQKPFTLDIFSKMIQDILELK